MPDPSSDDPFAELLGQLPDPRTRPLRPSDEDAASGAAGASDSSPVTAGVSAPGAPLSRRAAREAAARQTATGASGTVGPEATGESAPVSVTEAQATASGPPVAAPANPQAPVSAPTPVRVPAAPTIPAAEAARAAQEARAAQSTAPEAPVVGAQPATPAAPVRAADPDPVAPAAVDPVDEDAPWIFGGAGSAPAVPYSRSGNGFDPAATPASERQEPSAPTLDSLFSGHASTDDLGHAPPPKDKRKRRIGGWIALGVVLVILGGLVSGGLWVWNTYQSQIREVMGWEEPKDYADGMAQGETFVTVAKGDTGAPISDSLYEAGVTKTSTAFYDYLIDTQQNPPFVPGVFKLQKQMTSEAALAALLDPANKMENTAQLREGLTVDKSLEILAEATGLPLEDFNAAIANPADYGVPGDSLEGWLFPATYTFDPGVTAPQVIQTLVDRAVQSLDDAGVPVEDRHEILTIASIIQREARFSDDFYKVSRVIQNRLEPGNQETFGKLQMDSTAQFGYGENHDGTASTSAEALADPNPWNTYVHTGLPIGPIANPGDLAIDAAMHPADGDWLYFVTVNLDTGETAFTSNLADHNRAVDQWLSWCADHPDSGC